MLHFIFGVLAFFITIALIMGVLWGILCAPFALAEWLRETFTSKPPVPSVGDTAYAPEEIRARQDAFLADYRKTN